MKKVVVFGTKDFAQLAFFYLQHDSPYEVVAFSVNQTYLGAATSFEGLPLVPFEVVEKIYSPEQYAFFVPMAPTRMNKDREKIYLEAKQKGYELISYVSSRSTVYSNNQIGENCFIWENNTFQPYAIIGNNVTVCTGNIIGHHVLVGDHVFLANAVLTGHVTVGSYCFFGVGTSVREGVTIAAGTYVAMNSAVVADTEPWSVYRGHIAAKQEKSSLEM